MEINTLGTHECTAATRSWVVHVNPLNMGACIHARASEASDCITRFKTSLLRLRLFALAALSREETNFFGMRTTTGMDDAGTVFFTFLTPCVYSH